MLKRTHVLALLIVAAPVAAPPGAVAADPNAGFYAGGAVGQSKAKDACDGITGAGFAGSCDETDTAWKIFGGYQFNRNLGAELGYVDLGKFTASGTVGGTPANASAKAKGFELVGVAAYPFNDQFSVYGKAGAFRWDVDTSASAGGTAGSASDNGTDFTVGAGLKYNFTKNAAARLEFQRYNNVGDSGTTGQSDVNLWTLGLMYSF